MTSQDQTPAEHEDAPLQVIGQPAWYYGDLTKTSGMKSNAEGRPFAAFIVDVLSDRLVNLVVFDHRGTMFPLESVPVFHGDDQDDWAVPAHCELSAEPLVKPEPVVQEAEENPVDNLQDDGAFDPYPYMPAPASTSQPAAVVQ